MWSSTGLSPGDIVLGVPTAAVWWEASISARPTFFFDFGLVLEVGADVVPCVCGVREMAGKKIAQ